MVTAPDTPDRVSRAATGAGGLAFLAAALVACVWFFWPGITSLVRAWGVPEYSHGPIIPFISLFLFLREMRRVPPVDHEIRDRWPGIGVMLAGVALGAVGRVAQIDHFVTYGMIVWAAGLIVLCFGLRRGLLFWPAVVHLSFMLPLPQFIYWQTSSFLQTVSSEIGVWVIAMMGIPVYLDGNIIDLGVYKLQVAEACSGLRYLFPMLSFSFVFAVLYRGPKWHKAVLLLSAAPITVLMNSFRVGMIGVLVDSYGIEHAEGFLHAFEGWIIFLACVCILFLIAMGLQRLTRRPMPLAEALDIEFEGLGAQLLRARGVVQSAALAAGIALTFAAAGAATFAPQRETVRPARDPMALFPLDVGGWSGSRGQRLDPGIEAVLAADDYLMMTFVRPDERHAVDLFAAYYHDQTDGTGIHSPEVCIPSGGWEVSDWRQIEIPLAEGGAIEANRAVIQKGAARQLVYFWFDMRGRRIAGDFEAKFVTVLDSAMDGRSDGALVRLITPLAPGESQEAADGRLRGFAADLEPVMSRFVPK